MTGRRARRRGLDFSRHFQRRFGPSGVSELGQQPIKDRLRANTEELIERGGFGSPSLFVGDDMYFGNDRLPLVRAALERAGAE